MPDALHIRGVAGVCVGRLGGALLRGSWIGVAKPRASSAGLSRMKAHEMLEHGEVRGKPITKKQRGYFGAVYRGKARKRGR